MASQLLRSLSLDGTPLTAGVPDSFLKDHAALDCAMREAAMRFALKLQRDQQLHPGRLAPIGLAQTVQEALALGLHCNRSLTPPTAADAAHSTPNMSGTPSPALTFFASPAGSDSAGSGSQQAPFASIARALDAVRTARRRPTISTASRDEHAPATVFLRAGRYHLQTPIEITPELSFLTIASFAGEEVVLSGGMVLPISGWTRAWQESERGDDERVPIWAASLAGVGLDSLPGLRLNGERVTLARYPNSDPERDMYPKGWISARGAAWHVSPPGPQPTFVTTSEPSYAPLERNVYQRHMVGVGGPCSIFSPAVSYWCSEHPSSACTKVPDGSAAGQPAARFGLPPAGLTVSDVGGQKTLPHSPYSNSSGRMAGATLTAWRPGHWFNYRWRIAGYNATLNTSSFVFGEGGYQGGQQAVDAAEDFYIEGIIEELPPE